jgi:hypothetical protein
MSSANSIKVVARFRPQNRVEIESGGQPIVSFDGPDTCTVDVSDPAAVCLLMPGRMCADRDSHVVQRGTRLFYFRQSVSYGLETV